MDPKLKKDFTTKSCKTYISQINLAKFGYAKSVNYASFVGRNYSAINNPTNVLFVHPNTTDNAEELLQMASRYKNKN